MIIEGIEIPFGSKFHGLDNYDDEAPSFGDAIVEMTFDGKMWVDAPDDQFDEDDMDISKMDPKIAYWLARQYWRSSTMTPHMIGPDGREINIGGWDAPRS